jgi:hypothetical protein
MTEADWLACSDPQTMLDFLRGKASDRKLRLFACAAFRRGGVGLVLPADHEACALVERWADGAATASEAAGLLARLDNPGPIPDPFQWMLEPPAALLVPDPFEAARRQRREGPDDPDAARLAIDVFGNPFRSVTINPDWLTWNGGTVPKLAQTIYDERRFQDLPILADALVLQPS